MNKGTSEVEVRAKYTPESSERSLDLFAPRQLSQQLDAVFLIPHDTGDAQEKYQSFAKWAGIDVETCPSKWVETSGLTRVDLSHFRDLGDVLVPVFEEGGTAAEEHHLRVERFCLAQCLRREYGCEIPDKVTGTCMISEKRFIVYTELPNRAEMLIRGFRIVDKHVAQDLPEQSELRSQLTSLLSETSATFEDSSAGRTGHHCFQDIEAQQGMLSPTDITTGSSCSMM